MVNKNFWKNKKVLITGHSGFKGSWLTFLLNSLGSKVYGYSLRPNTNPSLYKILKISNLIQNEFGDINNLKKISNIIEKVKPEILIHLAAQPLVRESYKFPYLTYKTNIMGLMNTLLSIKNNITKECSILIVTSDKCYLNEGQKRFFIEKDPLGGNDIYSSSKACAEILSQSFQKSFFESTKINLSTARAGNIIGGGDWSTDRLITDLIRHIYENKKITIRYPNSVRPWQHVLEPLVGYLRIIEKMSTDKKSLGSWNLGPLSKKQITVQKIIELSEQYLKKRINYKIENIKNTPHEDKIILLSTNKIRNKLGWKPKLNIFETIKMTFEWYDAYYSKKNIIKFTQNQVDQYLDL